MSSGASRIGGEAVELGAPIIFLVLLGGLNVFIGVFNLFPLLPLDGGHIAIAWYERARSWFAARRGRPDPGRVDYNKLLPVTYAGDPAVRRADPAHPGRRHRQPDHPAARPCTT